MDHLKKAAQIALIDCMNVKKGEKNNSHSMSFITCNAINYFYDNENGMIQFNWKLYFQKIIIITK